MSLIATMPLLAYLAIAGGCDLRRGRVPVWCSTLALGGAGTVAVLPDGRGLGMAAAGSALAILLLSIPAALGIVTRSDVGFAAVSGAWLGPGLVLQGLVLGCAAVLLAALGLVAAQSPRLLLQLPHVLGPLTAPVRAHHAIPCTLPLAAGFAAAALLAARG